MSLELKIVITEHTVWGTILVPCLVYKHAKSGFFVVEAKLNEKNYASYLKSIPNELIDCIKPLFDINEKKISKIAGQKTIGYSKQKNELIKSYVSRYNRQCISQLKDLGYDVLFVLKPKNNEFSINDKVRIVSKNADVVFCFDKNTNSTNYSIRIKHGNNIIDLYKKTYKIISENPCVILINNDLFVFNEIDAKKLLPFFNKQDIKIKAELEQKYYDTFVKQIVAKYSYCFTGINEKDIATSPKAVLVLEKNWQNKTVLTLSFDYGAKIILASSSMQKVVWFHFDNQSVEMHYVQRDSNIENQTIKLLKSIGLELDKAELYHQKYSNDKYSFIRFINEYSTFFKSNNILITQRLDNDRYILEKPEITFQIQERIDWFDLKSMVKIGKYSIPFYEFREHILNNNPVFHLSDDYVFIIPELWFSRYRFLFVYSKNKGKDFVVQKAHIHFFKKKIYNEKLPTEGFDYETSKIELPKILNAKLRPYQTDGYRWLVWCVENGFGALLADDMGLGKTLQIIALMGFLKEKYGDTNVLPGKQLDLFEDTYVSPKPFLVVMPTSLIFNWKLEIKRFYPNLKTTVYHGNKRNLNKISQFDVVLTSYGVIRNDIAQLQGISFKMMVLDESQMIKNPASKSHQAIRKMQCDSIIAVSGTPIENNLIELWAQMRCANADLLGSLPFFKREFIVPIEKKNSKQAENDLKRLLKPFVLRRTKSQVAKDLPSITHQTVYCTMNAKQHDLYEVERAKMRNYLMENIEEQGVKKSSVFILKALMQMRLCAIHPTLIDKDYNDDSGKFIEIQRFLDELYFSNHKILIFSSFVKHLDLVDDYLQQNNRQLCRLTGETKNRDKIIEQFQNDNQIKYFLISLKAGGTGLNLTAADYVLLIDPWWNISAENQAVNRAHRIGQTKNVFVYRFIVKDSIEEKILQLQQQKNKLANTFINSNNPLQNLNMGEIKKLFS